MFRRSLIACSIVLAGVVLVNPAIGQQQVRVTVTNLQPGNGFFLTPVWFGLHDGSFDYFNSGAAASASLEMLAEDGVVAGLQGDFSGSQFNGVQGVVLNPAGFGGAPILDPGETGQTTVSVTNTIASRYFSYASMVIPSNDAFIGNDNAMMFQLFDAGGNYTGPVTFDVFGANIWDSGTEVNDTMGAAFSTLGGMSSDENGVIAQHPGLANFLGSGTAAGTTIGSIPAGATPIARFTISAVPEPSGLMVLGLFAAVGSVRRRTRIGS
jgi:hypothetical protein